MTKSSLRAVIFGLLVLLSLVLLRATDPFFVSAVRELALDQFQRFSPRPHVEQPVRVVDIDEAALAEFGQWPWSRDRLADLVNHLDQFGAAAIVFDIVFAEPDRLSPSRVLRGIGLEDLLAEKPDIAAALRDTDTDLAAAMAERPVVLAFAIATGAGAAAPAAKAGFAFTGVHTLTALPHFDRVTPVVPELQAAASGLGSMSLSPGDMTGTVRKLPLVLTDGTQPYPSLVLEALRVALGASTYVIRGAPTPPATVEDIRVGPFTIPTTGAGELWMYYRPNSPDLYVPVGAMLRGDDSDRLRALIDGHIVLIGTSASGLIDIRATALSENVPGVAIHAQALEQILSGSFLWRPDWTDGIEIAAVVFIGLMIIVATMVFGPTVSFAVGGICAVGVALSTGLAFRHYGLLIDASFPLVAGVMVQLGITGYRYLIADRDARFVGKAFARYVSPAVLSQLQRQPDMLKLGGEVRELTVMFADVRNFTPFSENLTPEELISFLNRLLGELSRCVVQEHGTIDKYIGDSLMAFWNAPVTLHEHQRRACLAALSMRKGVARLNAENAFDLHGRGLPVDHVTIGIGLNSGMACVGNMGSEDRFDYSCVGDTVNVAARVESACKNLHFDIVVTAATAAALTDMALLEAGALPLKGKSARQSVHIVVGDAETRSNPDFVKLSGYHDQLLAAIRDGHHKDTERLASMCAELSRAICEPLEQFYRRLPDRLDDFHLPATSPEASQALVPQSVPPPC
jgi:adenylate cyclase